MLQAKKLRGRAVVDVDHGKKLGEIDEILLDPSGQRIAGLSVSKGSGPRGGKHGTILPAAAIHAIGEDVITVRQAGAGAELGGDLSTFPRLSKVLGRKMVTQGGKVLGAVDDVLLADEPGQIRGYTLGAAHEPGGVMDALLGGGKQHRPDYVRADADIRVGEDVIVVPDDAVIHGDSPESEGPSSAPEPAGWATEAHPRTPERTAAARAETEHNYDEAARLLQGSGPEGRRAPEH